MIRFSKLFFAILVSGLLFVSCDKTENQEPGEVIVVSNNEEENIQKERVVLYTVNGQENRYTMETEAEWDAFLDKLCDYARSNGEIAFYNISQNNIVNSKAKNGSKDSRTITTTSRAEIKAWMKKMEKDGLTVKVTYDSDSDTWSGVAYATAPAYNVSNEIVGTWHFSCMVVTETDADGNVQNSDLYAPEEDGGTMLYTFNSDGTMSMTFHAMDGSAATDNSTWTLSEDGTLSCSLLPNGLVWNVNWITNSTMIMSQANINGEDGNVFYQLQFDAVE